MSKLMHKLTMGVAGNPGGRKKGPVDLSPGSGVSNAVDYTTTAAYARDKQRKATGGTPSPTVLDKREVLG